MAKIKKVNKAEFLKYGAKNIPITCLTSSEVGEYYEALNVEILHCSQQYAELMQVLSEVPKMKFVCPNDGDATFFHYGITFNILEVVGDDIGHLTIYINSSVSPLRYALNEKEIRPYYLDELVGLVKRCCIGDIMDCTNAHNKKLVCQINDAWKQKHDRFAPILLAMLIRDAQEYEDKFETPRLTEEYALAHAHEILQGVCDDYDLECVLNFLRVL